MTTFLNMAEQIQEAVVRIRLQDSSIPLHIAAQVAPNLTYLEGTQADLHEPFEQSDDYLQMNAAMVTSASSSESNEPSQNCTNESLNWNMVTHTTMYQQALHNASPDQKLVIDKVFTHSIVDNYTDKLLLFITGGAGVGKSFLIRTIKEMLVRTQQHHNPVLLTAPTGIASYNIL